MSLSRCASAVILFAVLTEASWAEPLPALQQQGTTLTPGDTVVAPMAPPQAADQTPAFGSGVSFFPIPKIGSGKNEGTTLGLIGAFLYAGNTGAVESIFSTSASYRSLVGWNLSAAYRSNPTPYSFFEFFGSKSQRVEEEFQAFFEDKRVDHGRYSMLFEFDKSVVTTYRFYGREDDAPQSNESAYTGAAYRTRLYFGPNITEKLSLLGTFRFGHMNIEDSLITDLPQTLDAYPNEPGIETGNIYALGLSLVYENRDNVNTPTRGEYGNVFGEAVRFITDSSDVPYYRIGAEAKKLWPWSEEAALVTVLRIKGQFEFGDSIPFYELSSLGGPKSLRGYGAQRFTNNSILLMNLEQRIRVAQVTVFGVKGDVQLAPFVDLGQVFADVNDLAENGVSGFHYSYGIGIRGVVSPYVVGTIDIGFAPGSSALAIGIDYPF
jgi:outer membrane protein assembly factor BamA